MSLPLVNNPGSAPNMTLNKFLKYLHKYMYYIFKGRMVIAIFIVSLPPGKEEHWVELQLVEIMIDFKGNL